LFDVDPVALPPWTRKKRWIDQNEIVCNGDWTVEQTVVHVTCIQLSIAFKAKTTNVKTETKFAS
jgi:hypothetical protein